VVFLDYKVRCTSCRIAKCERERRGQFAPERPRQSVFQGDSPGRGRTVKHIISYAMFKSAALIISDSSQERAQFPGSSASLSVALTLAQQPREAGPPEANQTGGFMQPVLNRLSATRVHVGAAITQDLGISADAKTRPNGVRVLPSASDRYAQRRRRQATGRRSPGGVSSAAALCKTGVCLAQWTWPSSDRAFKTL